MPQVRARVDREGALGIDLGGPGLARVARPFHVRRRLDIAVIEARRQFHVFRLVHVPVPAGRRERVMGIGEGRHQEERLVAALGGVAVDIVQGFFPDIAGRIEFFRDRRAIGLRADVIVVELVVAVAQRIGVGALLFEPDIILAADMVRMLGAQIDMLEAVKRQVHVVGLARFPAVGMFLVVIALGIGFEGFRNSVAQRRVAFLRVGPVMHRRQAGHVLDVALADQGGRIAADAHALDEGARPHVERDAVRPHPVQRRHAAGDKGRPVGLADRGGDVEAVEFRALRGDRIDMGRFQHRMPAAAEMVGTVLVGNDEQEIRTVGHGRSRVSVLFYGVSISGTKPGLSVQSDVSSSSASRVIRSPRR